MDRSNKFQHFHAELPYKGIYQNVKNTPEARLWTFKWYLVIYSGPRLSIFSLDVFNCLCMSLDTESVNAFSAPIGVKKNSWIHFVFVAFRHLLSIFRLLYIIDTHRVYFCSRFTRKLLEFGVFLYIFVEARGPWSCICVYGSGALDFDHLVQKDHKYFWKMPKSWTLSCHCLTFPFAHADFLTIITKQVSYLLSGQSFKYNCFCQ